MITVHRRRLSSPQFNLFRRRSLPFFVRFLYEAGPSPFQGGIKVLVAGSWESGNAGAAALLPAPGGESYVVLFDGVPVPTETVHPGLLKCHAPGESPWDSLSWMSLVIAKTILEAK